MNEQYEIAKLISEDEEGYEKCPKCGNEFMMAADGKLSCPNRDCELYDPQYLAALKQIILPEGVVDYGSLVNWFRLYVPHKKLKHKSIYDWIAEIMANFEIGMIDRPKEMLEELLYYGFPGYANNTSLLKDNVNERLTDSPEIFFALFEDEFGIYHHRDDYEEGDGSYGPPINVY